MVRRQQQSHRPASTLCSSHAMLAITVTELVFCSRP
jgi:hypothetical protein